MFHILHALFFATHVQVDEKEVSEIHIPDYLDLRNEETHRYPYAGAINASVRLCVVDVALLPSFSRYVGEICSSESSQNKSTSAPTH